ncbi:hypothetical protein STRTUCAR8_10148 [Streptomyces turgidiscabies Car8]|uniref:Uncharacterized protein n=1 Tax=Streptomyces turgidiscabies (strain Car8) TaxID=698760 RepID=L7FFR3_STRT8|nr:hypothetical protein STRTUCAR8_10148 [Streptomyces turgidiscabies Car8]GAQ72900.1 hypothetical protein T45_04656 [Streptomyces turgidiscabies]
MPPAKGLARDRFKRHRIPVNTGGDSDQSNVRPVRSMVAGLEVAPLTSVDQTHAQAHTVACCGKPPGQT